MDESKAQTLDAQQPGVGLSRFQALVPFCCTAKTLSTSTRPRTIRGAETERFQRRNFAHGDSAVDGSRALSDFVLSLDPIQSDNGSFALKARLRCPTMFKIRCCAERKGKHVALQKPHHLQQSDWRVPVLPGTGAFMNCVSRSSSVLRSSELCLETLLCTLSCCNSPSETSCIVCLHRSLLAAIFAIAVC